VVITVFGFPGKKGSKWLEEQEGETGWSAIPKKTHNPNKVNRSLKEERKVMDKKKGGPIEGGHLRWTHIKSTKANEDPIKRRKDSDTNAREVHWDQSSGNL